MLAHELHKGKEGLDVALGSFNGHAADARLQGGDLSDLVALADLELSAERFLEECLDIRSEGMIDAMEAAGTIGPWTVLAEPTSGNTGIALAFVAAALDCRGGRGPPGWLAFGLSGWL
jgi:hypothetical protein